MSKQINSIIPQGRAASALLAKIREGVPVSVFGMSFGERTYVAAASGVFFVYVTTDYVAAHLALRQLNQLTGGGVYHLPAQGDVLSYAQARDMTIPSERLAAFGAMTEGRARGIVTTAEALCQIVPKPSAFVSSTLRLTKGEEISLDRVVENLTRGGYAHTGLVQSAGQFSRRGDILDIFAAGETAPVRVELWGDFVEKIKRIDPETQMSMEEIDVFTVLPACEALFDDDAARDALQKINAHKVVLPPDFAARREHILSEINAKLEGGARDSALEFVLPYVPHGTAADYMPKDALIVYDETKAVLDALLQTEKEHVNRSKTLLESGEILKLSVDRLLDFEAFKRVFSPFNKLSFARITSSNLFFDPQELLNYQCSPITKYSLNFAELAQDLRVWSSRGYRIALCCRDAEGVRAVREGLDAQDFPAGEAEDLEDFWYAKGGAVLLARELERGFSFHEERMIVIGSGDIFPVKSKRVARAANRVFVQPSPGDFVVHYVHGIGKCLRTKKIESSLGAKDYLEIEYRDGDKLYVPVDQMDLISKYSGESPRLSKMGGKEFARVKARVKEGVKAMAIDLVQLYGARKEIKGHSYSADEALMKEFLSYFPYESTADQTTATQEMLDDLKSGKIMDRLLVGDVGYGKTEVAMRAAFAVIMEGRQAALLAPTTILSEQHYRTAVKRFAPFGIRIAILNRFHTAQKDVLDKIARGQVDLIIGTHRLLSNDVIFHELGLLVLDEEQRFGVAHKEKIKSYHNSVNVLTMTATPIPRTLHMSLAGIRDISTLTMPPADRLPVQTAVTEYTDALARDCILRETARGGQTFIVYNRVETIYRYASQLQAVLPEGIRMIVCHGQMNESELENNIKRFYDGEGDVLITTTIIENGIDLPAANTLLVVDADKLGLSQLYQLRGRVGRSNRLAYAYFTFTAGKSLSETAVKRLQTLTEFTEFGSGFRIAMRDLEIRGAGNVLGREQHGHMEKVGYDLYCKLLNEAVAEARGEGVKSTGECEVVTDTDAYLPSEYVSDEEGRMNLYARVAAIRKRGDRDRLMGELKDVYGEVPLPVQNLLTVGLLKGYGVRLGIKEIRLTRSAAVLTLREMEEWVSELLSRKTYRCTLKPTQLPLIVFSRGENGYYENVLRFLTEGISVKNSIVKTG